MYTPHTCALSCSWLCQWMSPTQTESHRMTLQRHTAHQGCKGVCVREGEGGYKRVWRREKGGIIVHVSRERFLDQKLVVSYLPEACSCPVNTDMEAISTAYQEREKDYYFLTRLLILKTVEPCGGRANFGPELLDYHSKVVSPYVCSTN